MGKKKMNKEGKLEPEEEDQNKKEEHDIEGKFLLGKPKFKKLDNGRYKCLETGHELPADARDSYALTKHCRVGLIDSALARNKPPLNMFRQDPLSRSRLICKLTGHTVNKTEEHIWKHINGKRFLNMLEKEEAEAVKKASDGIMEEEGEEKPEKAVNIEEDGLKKKKKNKKKKKQKQKDEDVHKIISEVRNSEEKDSDTEEDEFWMPPIGDRWDFDDGKDRWASGSESDSNPETDDANEADDAGKESITDSGELAKRTKRMSIEIEPTDFTLSKKKKKQKLQSSG